MGKTKEIDTSPMTHEELDLKKNPTEEEVVLGMIRGSQKRRMYPFHADPNLAPPTRAVHKRVCLARPL